MKICVDCGRIVGETSDFEGAKFLRPFKCGCIKRIREASA